MHTLYTGVSLTGKTTLARSIARQLHAKGHRGIVYDPTLTATLGGGWGFPDV
jgi:adenylylsulfate kinase-like enzyme